MCTETFKCFWRWQSCSRWEITTRLRYDVSLSLNDTGKEGRRGRELIKRCWSDVGGASLPRQEKWSDVVNFSPQAIRPSRNSFFKYVVSAILFFLSLFVCFFYSYFPLFSFFSVSFCISLYVCFFYFYFPFFSFFLPFFFLFIAAVNTTDGNGIMLIPYLHGIDYW